MRLRKIDNDGKEYLLSSQAADFLDISKSTLYNLHNSGKLVPEKVNMITGIRLYSQKQLEEFRNNYTRKKYRLKNQMTRVELN